MHKIKPKEYGKEPNAMIKFECHVCRGDHLLEDKQCVLLVETTKIPTRCPFEPVLLDAKWVRV